jgi:hypothetical protein
LSKEEREKYQKARKAIENFEFYSDIEKRIDCYIEMLSEEKYTGYEKGKPNDSNIFGVEKEIPFKGYEDIEGLNTSQFWRSNSDKIENRLEELESKEDLSKEEREKYQRVRKAIENFEFYNQLEKRIDCYIEMLSEEKYTGYDNGKPNNSNIFGTRNKVPFKGYEDIEGLNTSQFWSRNSDKIEKRLEELESKEDLSKEEFEKYQRARKAIEKYRNQINSKQSLEKNSIELTLSDIEKAGNLVRGIIDQDKEIA